MGGQEELKVLKLPNRRDSSGVQYYFKTLRADIEYIEMETMVP